MWRYSRIDGLDLEMVAPSVGEDPLTAAPDVEPATRLLDRLRDELAQAAGGPAGLAACAIVVDGVVASIEIAPDAGAAGLEVVRAGAGDEHAAMPGRVFVASDALDHLHEAFVADPLAVIVPPGADLAGFGPVVVAHVSARAGVATFPRAIVHVGAEGSAHVIEVAMGSAAGSVRFPVTELEVGDGARLGYLYVQRLGDAMRQVGRQVSRVGASARLESFAVALGGSVARLRTDSTLAGAGGECVLAAVYRGRRDQLHDLRTLQDHDAPHTKSLLVSAGALDDNAHSVYSGLVRMRKGAVRSEANQTNRNLLLSSGAHADSIPNLDIQENDVTCNHASAVGPIDAEQRHYLESRGVRPEVADELIVAGFYDGVLEHLPVSALAGWIREGLGTRRARSAGGDLGALGDLGARPAREGTEGTGA